MKTKIFLLLVSLFTTHLFAAEFEEGTHYTVLETPLSDKKGVTEFFSFYCPHCFSQEAFMRDLDASLPDGIKLQKNHVDMMPGRDIAIEQALTKALIVAELLKVKEPVVDAVFRKIHVEKGDFSSIDDIKAVFVSHGVEGDKFDKAMKSFSVVPKAKKMAMKTTELRKQGIGTVPTLIVNGKYYANTRSIKSFDEYKELVLFLVGLPL